MDDFEAWYERLARQEGFYWDDDEVAGIYTIDRTDGKKFIYVKEALRMAWETGFLLGQEYEKKGWKP